MQTNDLLILLIEECSEVIHAATKCLRFGYEHNEPGYGQNDIVLSRELGELVGVIKALPYDTAVYTDAMDNKMDRARELYEKFKPMARGHVTGDT